MSPGWHSTAQLTYLYRLQRIQDTNLHYFTNSSTDGFHYRPVKNESAATRANVLGAMQPPPYQHYRRQHCQARPTAGLLNATQNIFALITGKFCCTAQRLTHVKTYFCFMGSFAGIWAGKLRTYATDPTAATLATAAMPRALPAALIPARPPPPRPSSSLKFMLLPSAL